jgi:hypothetical protein
MIQFLHTKTTLLDAGSVTTFIGGIVSGQVLLMILGGVASIAAIINHGDQWMERRRNRKNKQS